MVAENPMDCETRRALRDFWEVKSDKRDGGFRAGEWREGPREVPDANSETPIMSE